MNNARVARPTASMRTFFFRGDLIQSVQQLTDVENSLFVGQLLDKLDPCGTCMMGSVEVGGQLLDKLDPCASCMMGNVEVRLDPCGSCMMGNVEVGFVLMSWQCAC